MLKVRKDGFVSRTFFERISIEDFAFVVDRKTVCDWRTLEVEVNARMKNDQENKTDSEAGGCDKAFW
jgi:hypothetical protein